MQLVPTKSCNLFLKGRESVTPEQLLHFAASYNQPLPMPSKVYFVTWSCYKYCSILANKICFCFIFSFFSSKNQLPFIYYHFIYFYLAKYIRICLIFKYTFPSCILFSYWRHWNNSDHLMALAKNSQINQLSQLGHRKFWSWNSFNSEACRQWEKWDKIFRIFQVKIIDHNFSALLTFDLAVFA